MRCRQEQQDGGRVEQQRHDQDEVAHGCFVGRAEQRRQLTHRTEVGLDGLALAVDRRLLHLELANFPASVVRLATSSARFLRCWSASTMAALPLPLGVGWVGRS